MGFGNMGFGRSGSTPDFSKQREEIKKQQEEVDKQREEVVEQKNQIAKKTTSDVKSLRRRSRGRASLITTSERGFLENNMLKP
jgi:hypothetical protein